MQLTIRSVSGSSFEVSVAEDATVGQARQAVSASANIVPEKIRLLYQNVAMEDDGATLASFGIKDRAEVHMVMRLAGLASAQQAMIAPGVGRATIPTTVASSAAAHVPQGAAPIIETVDTKPLPAGWDMQRTPEGRPYFRHHATHSTTWLDPRLKDPTLPSHIEIKLSPEGQFFYVNHQTRTTSWFRPTQ